MSKDGLLGPKALDAIKLDYRGSKVPVNFSEVNCWMENQTFVEMKKDQESFCPICFPLMDLVIKTPHLTSH